MGKKRSYLLTRKERKDIPITLDDWCDDAEIIGKAYVCSFIDWLLDNDDFGTSADRILLIKERNELSK
jgi:hypothetical protein